jgi:hypothetical protein
MCDLLDFIDWIWSPAEWRKMNGPTAFTAALIGGWLGLLLFAIAGGVASTGSNTMSVRLFALGPALIGLSMLGSVILGIIAFLRQP